MKIAVTGKGGVGKTTIVALMARALRDAGHKVLAVDADPDMNLASLLGVSDSVTITPIVELKDLIAERTETKPGQPAPFFKMNPRVDDIPETYCVEHEGVRVIVMGTVKKGGGGCACPENAFLKTLLGHLVVQRDEWVLLDMEAGIEHLGRGTAIGVDRMLIVVEPNRTSVATAERITKLAGDIGIRRPLVIGNKIRSDADRRFVADNTEGFIVGGFVDWTDEMSELSTGQTSVFDLPARSVEPVKQILEQLDGDRKK